VESVNLHDKISASKSSLTFGFLVSYTQISDDPYEKLKKTI
jgi:hypothetical protein